MIANNPKNKKMNSSKKTIKGFSFVEVLISLAIITIMTGILFASNNNKGKQEVQLAAREIAAQLRLLQNEALNGKVINGEAICKIEMNLDAVNNKYEIRYYDRCSPDNQIATAGPFKPKKSKLLHTGSIVFTVPMAEVPIGGLNGFVLESENNQKMTICVKAGNITEIKGNNIAACGF